MGETRLRAREAAAMVDPMRVTFPRLSDHDWGYAVVERDDGVVYRLWEGRRGPGLPHDLVHYLVERELGLADGIWGAIAAGVVFRSTTHVGGRRPPHAADRSAELKRDFGARFLRAELLPGLVEQVAALNTRDPDGIRSMARRHLAVLPDAEVDPAAVVTAAGALRDAARQWRALRPGAELSSTWPLPPPATPRRRRRPPATARRRR
jgi:hypothetical protein